MDFKTKHIGAYGGNSASIIELTVEGFDDTMTETITDTKDRVDENLIATLRDLADELQEHNEKL